MIALDFCGSVGGDGLLFDSDSNVTCGDEFLVEMAASRLQGSVVAGFVV